MVLELLISPKKAERKPWELLFIGGLYASVALLIAMWVFMSEASLVMVFLTVLACIPLLHSAIIREESKEAVDELSLLKKHRFIISYLMFLFVGFVIVMTLWFVLLPSDVALNVFDSQINTIKSINANLATNAISPAYLLPIIENNMKVLFFCVFFSFFYGAGAIFVLTWNASVISAAMGMFIRNNISTYAAELGYYNLGLYFQVFSLSVLRYMTHGIFEILAYFIGGLAGGLISMAMIKHQVEQKKFKEVMFDSFNLIFVAVLILVFAALVEVFVTPRIVG